MAQRKYRAANVLGAASSLSRCWRGAGGIATVDAARAAGLASVEDIEREFDAARRSGAHFVAMGEAEYPPHLANIDAAPPLVAVRGTLSVFQRPAVAIVGSRNASAAGLAFAGRLTRGLADAGFVIVSGLARGIDIRAHQISRESGTIAVLAGGLDRIYPANHTPILESLLGNGAAVSEMPFGWEARGRDFPRRNRIISGLANGVVIVEAAQRFGSLITARFAAEQGREIFAVPVRRSIRAPRAPTALSGTVQRSAPLLTTWLKAWHGRSPIPCVRIFYQRIRAVLWTMNRYGTNSIYPR